MDSDALAPFAWVLLFVIPVVVAGYLVQLVVREVAREGHAGGSPVA